jgi:hypothetical protein
MANNRITRDLDDRLQGRVDELKARSEISSPDEAVKRERLEAFRDKWSNNALPDVPGGLLPGMHLCWLSTTNQYDSIDKRIALGYEPVKAAELGKGFEHLGKMSSGKFEGCISCNEMILFKLPILWNTSVTLRRRFVHRPKVVRADAPFWKVVSWRWKKMHIDPHITCGLVKQL